MNNESSEKEREVVVATTSSQTQDSLPLKTQHVDPPPEENTRNQSQKDAKMVQAQTQTRKHKGANKSTQTVAVFQMNQETQTDFLVPKQEDANNEKIQPGTGGPAEAQPEEDKHAAECEQHDNTVQTPSGQNENPVGDTSSESKPEEERVPSAGVPADATTSQTEKEAKPKSYANAVSAGGEKQSSVAAAKTADKTSERTR